MLVTKCQAKFYILLRWTEMNKLAYLALYFAIALACEKYCNGHGTCGAKDKCECYMGWGGSDCSLSIN